MANPGRPVKKLSVSSPAEEKKHRLPGMKAPTPAKAPTPTPAPTPVASTSQAAAALDDLFNAVQTNQVTPTKKSDKPVITLENHASELLELQQLKSESKVVEGRIRQLEGELLPLIEEKRMEINFSKQEYIPTIYVQATGVDDDGKPIQAGQARYTVQRRYGVFNGRTPSKDEELQKTFGGKATIKDEVVAAIMAQFSVDQARATQMLDERMKVENTITLKPGALQNPEVLKVLREHLAPYLDAVSTMSPTTGFAERSNYVEEDRFLMELLNNQGLCNRVKPTLASSGAPSED